VTSIAELTVADDPERWRSAGFTVDEEGLCQIGSVRLRISPGSDGRSGVLGWVLAGTPDEEVTDVDGLPTAIGEPSGAPAGDHPVGARVIDHIVVTTPDLDRTIGAIERTLGLPLKRTRDGEAYGRPMRQAFFRMGEVILEVVGSPEPDPSGGPARFFGIAVTVDSLEAARARLGPDAVGEAKPAVQPGRSIATLRSTAGLSVPVALMSV
jgi:catechol 2,3-dioxygenase-like lactoylglutathione lyase family enzyme